METQNINDQPVGFITEPAGQSNVPLFSFEVPAEKPRKYLVTDLLTGEESEVLDTDVRPLLKNPIIGMLNLDLGYTVGISPCSGVSPTKTIEKI